MEQLEREASHMKRFGVLVCVAWAWVCVGWSPPRLEWITPTNATWGPYYGFPLVVVTCQFRNVGGAPLRIGNVRSTCVCTKLSTPPAELAPGEVGEIVMITEQAPTAFRTTRDFGFIMMTDDPDHPIVVWSGVAEYEPTNGVGEISAEVGRGEKQAWAEAVVEVVGDEDIFKVGEGAVVEEVRGGDAWLEQTTEVEVKERGVVWGCGFDAKIELLGEAGLVRVILVDEGGRRYLGIESYAALDGVGKREFTRYGEETRVVSGVRPRKIVVQVEDARAKVERVWWVKKAAGEESREELLRRQQARKVAKLNGRAGTWEAGLTPQGVMRYEDKCKFFRGSLESGLLPNLQGMEYYRGGVIVLRTNPPREARSMPAAWPARMNWRLRHGYRLLTPVKDRGVNCESEAYALASALECNLNLFYNQHLDVTLAEEDLIELSGAWGNGAVDVMRAAEYCVEPGLVPTGCLVRGKGGKGVQRCEAWKEEVVKSAGVYLTNGISNDELRRLLVRYGVVPVGIPEWKQMMVVVGWETNAYGEAPVWVVRSSFGTEWGEEGYMRLSCDARVFEPVVVFMTPYTWGRREIKTVCNDSDGDKYCAWGIAPALPRSCCTCNCRSVQDFDDYDPRVGPHYPPSQ